MNNKKRNTKRNSRKNTKRNSRKNSRRNSRRNTKKNSRRNTKRNTKRNSRRNKTTKKIKNMKGGGLYYEGTNYQMPATPQLQGSGDNIYYNIDYAYDNLLNGFDIDNNNLNIDPTIADNYSMDNITGDVDYNFALSEQSMFY